MPHAVIKGTDKCIVRCQRKSKCEAGPAEQESDSAIATHLLSNE